MNYSLETLVNQVAVPDPQQISHRESRLPDARILRHDLQLVQHEFHSWLRAATLGMMEGTFSKSPMDPT